MSADKGRHHNSLQRGIDLVLFDYGQVLSLPPDPAAWSRMLDITGVNDKQLHDAYWKFRHDYDRNALNGLTYWHAVAREIGIVLTDEQIAMLQAADVDLWARPNQLMIACAKRLQLAGMRTAILSNIGDAMAAGLTARLDWLKRFECCVWSYALHMAKPETGIFRRTAELVQLAPELILFIDDKQENIAAAGEIGMQAVRYTSHAEFELKMRASGFSFLMDIGTAH